MNKVIKTAVLALGVVASESQATDYFKAQQSDDWTKQLSFGVVDNFLCKKFTEGCIYQNPLSEVSISTVSPQQEHEISGGLRLDALDVSSSTGKKGVRLDHLEYIWKPNDGQTLEVGLLKSDFFGSYDDSSIQGFPLGALGASLTHFDGFAGVTVTQDLPINENSEIGVSMTSARRSMDLNHYIDEGKDSSRAYLNGPGYSNTPSQFASLNLSTESDSYVIKGAVEWAKIEPATLSGASDPDQKNMTQASLILSEKAAYGQEKWRILSEYSDTKSCSDQDCYDDARYTVAGTYFIQSTPNETLSVTAGFNEQSSGVITLGAVSTIQTCSTVVSTTYAKTQDNEERYGGSFGLKCSIGL